MPTTREKRAIIDLINAYSELCPAESDKASIRKMIAEMRKEHESDKNICRALAASLYDGLGYGNWPSELAKDGF